MAFGRTAEVIGQYLKKGRPVYLEGRIQTRSWEAEGKKNYRTEIVVDSFQFGPQAAGTGSAEKSYSSNNSAPQGPSQDDSEPQGGGDAIQYPDDEINPEDIPF